MARLNFPPSSPNVKAPTRPPASIPSTTSNSFTSSYEPSNPFLDAPISAPSRVSSAPKRGITAHQRHAVSNHTNRHQSPEPSDTIARQPTSSLASTRQRTHLAEQSHTSTVDGLGAAHRGGSLSSSRSTTVTLNADLTGDTTLSSMKPLSGYKDNREKRSTEYYQPLQLQSTIPLAPPPMSLLHPDQRSSKQDSIPGQEVDDAEEAENPLIYLTPNQREAAMENLEIEVMDRIQKLRASINVLTSSLQFRGEAELNRLPAVVRSMTMEEFCFKYNGSAKEYLQRQTSSKSVADTAFLHAMGLTHSKRKRDPAPQSNDFWRYKRPSREDHATSTFEAALSSRSTDESSTHHVLGTRSQPTSQSSSNRHQANPFVDARLSLRPKE